MRPFSFTKHLPTRDPRRNGPRPLGKDGGINWGGKMGSGCWAAYSGDWGVPLVHEFFDIDRKRSTISD